MRLLIVTLVLVFLVACTDDTTWLEHDRALCGFCRELVSVKSAKADEGSFSLDENGNMSNAFCSEQCKKSYATKLAVSRLEDKYEWLKKRVKALEETESELVYSEPLLKIKVPEESEWVFDLSTIHIDKDYYEKIIIE